MIPDYTLVVGVDEKHLEQLSYTWPTWVKHKPSILLRPMVIFYDYEQVTPPSIKLVVSHPNLTLVRWSPKDVVYEGNQKDKWTNPQRYKMLSGFVYVPSFAVKTPYWLKIDTDVVATGVDDWIDEKWFEDDPAIISHPWSFTKPPEQMIVLDEWVEKNKQWIAQLAGFPPLNLEPEPGRDRLGHKRIISWCSFFKTEFTYHCAFDAYMTCGQGKLPVPSQDGYVWYCAKRKGLEIYRTRMKECGWQQWHTMGNVVKHSQEAIK